MSAGLTTITDVEASIVTLLGTLTVNGTPIAAYAYEPGLEGLSTPCATLFMPDIERPGIDEPEDQMGTNNWDMAWALRLYHDLDDAQRCQTELKVLVADAIELFDLNPTLGGASGVFECAIHKATSGAIHFNAQRPLMTYECELLARKYVATT